MVISPYDDGWLMGLETACTVPCSRGKHERMRTFEEVRLFCAQAAHEMNRVYCRALGDVSQTMWDDAPLWQQESALKGVDGVFAGNGPGASHESWLAEKNATGWKHGPVKDADKKEHPCMVPFNELPNDQQQKDVVFVATVRMMATVLGHPVQHGYTWGFEVADSLKVATRPA